MPPTPSDSARAYHAITKHQSDRYARSAGFMDWDSQPSPFRRFPGAALIKLPLGAPCTRLTFGQMARGEKPAPASQDPQGLAQIGRLLELGLGLTASKEFEGNRWILRANPSSGNLHPTEGYVILPEGSGHPAGVFHYAPQDHLLELRCSLDREGSNKLAALLPPGSFLVALSTIQWREAWKYGERAFRYCALDTGHAIGALEYSAACTGLHPVSVPGWSDTDLAGLLGLQREADFEELDPWEREGPDVLIAMTPAVNTDGESDILAIEISPGSLLQILAHGTWHGKANELSEVHHEWDVIHTTAAATERVATFPSALLPPRPAPFSALTWPLQDASLEQIIRGRRSAVSMRAGAKISLQAFTRMLDATLQREEFQPWRAWSEEPTVHLAIFVHRVEGLVPGLYFLERNSDHLEDLKGACRPDLLWDRHVAPSELGLPDLGLFLLRPGNSESVARAISCQQDIAADGVFSLGMVAKLAPLVDEDASKYRRLFWECGLIGQVLYIEAEAAGLRATGIGCFLDDMMHSLLGIQSDDWQVLYHFTVGVPIQDDRLQTSPPYAHLDRSKL